LKTNVYFVNKEKTVSCKHTLMHLTLCIGLIFIFTRVRKCNEQYELKFPYKHTNCKKKKPFSSPKLFAVNLSQINMTHVG